MPNIHPQEYNILTAVQHRLDIQRAPNVTYWTQTCLLPSITIEGGMLPAMRRDIPVPGGKLEFDPLTITFLIDQDLRNYEELFNWLLEIQNAKTYESMTSQLSLHFLTGQMNVSRTVNFYNAYPQNLTEISVNSDDPDAVQVVGSAIFQYSHFSFEKTNFSLELE